MTYIVLKAPLNSNQPTVCTVTDFSAEDKAGGVKFSTVVHGRPWQRVSHFGELCSPRSPKSAGELACTL